MWWVTSVFGVAVGTATLPVFSLEVYLVAVMSTNPDLPWWVCGPAAALGQVLGKGVHYLAARGALKLPRLLRRPLPVGSRYRRWLHDFGERCEQHPRRTVAVV